MKKLIFLTLATLLMMSGAAMAAGYLNNDDLSRPVQTIGPKAALSRSLTLGTKGYGTYSTLGRIMVTFTCRTAAGVLTKVKVSMNSDLANFLTADAATFSVADGTTRYGFTAYSTASAITCGVFGQ